MPANVLTGPGVQASAREGHMGNLGQFEARLLRLLAPSSNAAAAAAGGGGGPAAPAAGTGSPAPASAGPDPAAIAAAALDPLAANNILGLFCCFYYFVSQLITIYLDNHFVFTLYYILSVKHCIQSLYIFCIIFFFFSFRFFFVFVL